MPDPMFDEKDPNRKAQLLKLLTATHAQFLAVLEAGSEGNMEEVETRTKAMQRSYINLMYLSNECRTAEARETILRRLREKIDEKRRLTERLRDRIKTLDEEELGGGEGSMKQEITQLLLLC